MTKKSPEIIENQDLRFFLPPETVRKETLIFSVLTSVMVTLFIILIISDTDISFVIIVGIFSLLISIRSGLQLIKVRKSYVEITIDHLIHKLPFSKEEVDLNEISGYRKDSGIISIYRKNSNKAKLNFSTDYLKINAFQNWIDKNLIDLNIKEIEEYRQNLVVENRNDGREEEVIDRFNIAIQITKILFYLGTISSIWLLVYPVPYLYLVSFLVIYPFLVFATVLKFKGLIKMVGENKTREFLPLGLMLPFVGTTLAIRSYMDFKVVDWFDLVIPSIFIFITITAGFIITTYYTEKLTINIGPKVVIIISFLGYAVGTTTIVNCTFDSTNPEKYEVLILNKEITKGKNKEYLITVSAWGSYTELQSFSVDEEDYKKLKLMDKADIYLKEGKLQIPWYYIQFRK